MNSSHLNISPAIEQKWAEHAETLGRKYMRITGYVVLLTFCGGISTSLYYPKHASQNYALSVQDFQLLHSSKVVKFGL